MAESTSPPTGRFVLSLCATLVVSSCSPPIAVVQGPPGPAGEVPALQGTVSIDVSDSAGVSLSTATGVSWPLGLTATSDAEGVLLLTPLAVGTYRITVAAPDHAPVVLEAVPVAAGVVTEASVTLVPADDVLPSPALRVTVQRASGGPLPGATVDVDSGTWTAVTDADGVAEFDGIPPGDYEVITTPTTDSPAMPRTIPGVTVAGPDTTDLTVTCSGRPPQDATWIGSTGCATCHALQGTSHARSAHARPEPLLDLENAFLANTTVVFAAADGTPVTIHLFPGTPSLMVTIETAQGSASFPWIGNYGGSRTAQVPLLGLPGGGAAPAPVAWRIATGGFDAPPAFEPGLFAYELDRWVGAGGALVDHPATGGPAPEDLEAAACIGCHAVGAALFESGGLVTALATDGLSGAAIERGVGCEACHGPGSAHGDAAFEDRADLILQPGLLDRGQVDAICAQCHSRGTAPGFLTPVAFPYGNARPHRPDEALAAHFLSAPEQWPGGTPSAPNQQSDAFAGSAHADNEVYGLHCADCHDPHGPQPNGSGGAFPAQLVGDPDDNTLCLSCHQSLHFANADAVQDHTAHSGYGPGGPLASGRCTGCHMPGTATRFGVSEWTGGGELTSHALLVVQPQEALDVFDAEGVTTLPADLLPSNSCLSCHQWAAKRLLEDSGVNFWGPHGDPTLQSTYQSLQVAFESKFPEAR